MVMKSFFFNIALVIAFVTLIIASYTDIKTREVPDWISYGLIFTGLGSRLIFSLATFDWSYLVNGAVGLAIFFALAFIMFYSGQWGGGDSKVLMGLGALFGFTFSIDNFFLAFIINALIIGALYGLIWSIVLAIKNRKKFVKELKKLKTKWIRRIMYVLVIVLLLIAYLLNDFTTRIILSIIALLFFLMYYFWLFSKTVENTCMYKLIKLKDLTIGDWIAKEIKIRNKIIAGPKDLGITEKQIKQLKKLKVKKVLIKIGIPFVPAFLLGLLFTYFFGNIFLFFL